MRQRRVVLVEMPGQKGYLPLAAGYLVATARSDPKIESACTFDLMFPDMTSSPAAMSERIAVGTPPDLVAFSLQGWSLRWADRVAAKLKARYPRTIVIYGGNHVSFQGRRLLPQRSFVDCIVNGEGELVFRDILRGLIERDFNTRIFAEIAGVAFLDVDRNCHETSQPQRIQDLSTVPSPYLSGVLNVREPSILTALLETNRGCPYACSFCYWGAAVNSKLRQFDLDRVFREMELLAAAKVESWYICDANFGILKRDAAIVDKIIELRRTTEFPRVVHTNWAKNSNEIIVKLAASLNQSGTHSTFTIAAQSTDKQTLEYARRSNMAINQVEHLARLCRENGVIPRGELIWGLPGESYERFKESFDTLAAHTDAISVYPHYVLPNTDFDRYRDRFGIHTAQLEFDTDYEYCVEHADMSRRDFEKGLRFIVANNILNVASTFFVVYPRIAHRIAGIPPSAIIEQFADWLEDNTLPTAQALAAFVRRPAARHRHSLAQVWHAIGTDRDSFLDLVAAYLEEAIHAVVGSAEREVLREAYRYDRALFPIVDTPAIEEGTKSNEYMAQYTFDYDFLRVQRGEELQVSKRPLLYEIHYPKGLWRYAVDKWYFGLLSYRGRAQYTIAESVSGTEIGK
jgi:radical SAM C-methyltransferase